MANQIMVVSPKARTKKLNMFRKLSSKMTNDTDNNSLGGNMVD